MRRAAYAIVATSALLIGATGAVVFDVDSWIGSRNVAGSVIGDPRAAQIDRIEAIVAREFEFCEHVAKLKTLADSDDAIGRSARNSLKTLSSAVR